MKSIKSFNKLVLAMVGILFLIPVAFVVSPINPAHIFTKRFWASYSPGDCVQKVYGEVERWNIPDFGELLMITEVGNREYRVKGWGTRFSNQPHWYPEYESRSFFMLDDSSSHAHYARVACPEEQPEELAESAPSTFVTTGSAIRICSVDGGDFTVCSQ